MRSRCRAGLGCLLRLWSGLQQINGRVIGFLCMSTTTFDLVAAASAEMIREGFHPDFPNGTEAQVEQIRAALSGATAAATGDGVRDLRSLFWSSIDNATSRDLDQIDVAARTEGGIRVRQA